MSLLQQQRPWRIVILAFVSVTVFTMEEKEIVSVPSQSLCYLCEPLINEHRPVLYAILFCQFILYRAARTYDTHGFSFPSSSSTRVCFGPSSKTEHRLHPGIILSGANKGFL